MLYALFSLMRGGLTNGGGMGLPLLTKEETNLFGRSVCKIKRRLTEDLGFLPDFPFEPPSHELPSAAGVSPQNTSLRANVHL